jgi:hypothetical protein
VRRSVAASFDPKAKSSLKALRLVLFSNNGNCGSPFTHHDERCPEGGAGLARLALVDEREHGAAPRVPLLRVTKQLAG